MATKIHHRHSRKSRRRSIRLTLRAVGQSRVIDLVSQVLTVIVVLLIERLLGLPPTLPPK